MERVLVTGGAGFIGTHLVDLLLAAGDEVVVLDNVTEQVHGERPSLQLAPEAELLIGDVRDGDLVATALEGCSTVVHLAARVGVGQSMYEFSDYLDQNCFGTSILLETMLAKGSFPRRLVVASSMSLYGEGAYTSVLGKPVLVSRTREDLSLKRWEPHDADGNTVHSHPTTESKQLEPASVYALTKYVQERVVLTVASAYGIPAIALRLFNVYGRGQSLSNPYTGAIAIFASRLLNGSAPLVYEDGLQRRDFVHVSDVVQAIRLAMRSDCSNVALNIGSGQSSSLLQVCAHLNEALGLTIEPELPGSYRFGDVRHCYADIGAARALLGYEPKVSLRDGINDLAEWLLKQELPHDGVEGAASELESRGLTF